MEKTDWHYVVKSKTPITPEMGEEYCKNTYGTSLGSVHSQEESDAIMRSLKNMGGIDAWMGLYKDGSSWNWRDGTGENIMDLKTCYFSDWTSNEPSDGDDCVRMDPERGWAGCCVLSFSLFRIRMQTCGSFFRAKSYG